MIISKIEWDATKEEIEACQLPVEIRSPETDIAEEDIADWLSDRYGFCVKGLSYDPDAQDKESSFTLYEDMTNIVDSVQLESDDTNGSDICSFRQGNYLVTIEVRGAVKIWWNTTTDDLNNGEGMYYTYWSTFPEELKNLIRNTGTAENHWTLDPRVYVSENNWFEIFLWEKDGRGGREFLCSDCIDVEGETPESLRASCEEYLASYLKAAA